MRTAPHILYLEWIARRANYYTCVVCKLYILTQAHTYADIEFEFAHVLERVIKDLHEEISDPISVLRNATRKEELPRGDDGLKNTFTN